MSEARGSAFREALESSLGHPLDRRILLTLHDAERDVRYEELRRAVSTADRKVSPQAFKLAVNRLSACAALNRRLEPLGENKYASHLSLTKQGSMVADLLRTFLQAVEQGRLTRKEFPVTVRQAAVSVLRGEELRGEGLAAA